MSTLATQVGTQEGKLCMVCAQIEKTDRNKRSAFLLSNPVDQGSFVCVQTNLALQEISEALFT